MVSTCSSSSSTALTWWKAPTDPAVREQRCGLLGGAALLDRQGVGTLLVEAERVDAVDDELAGQLTGQLLQQRAVAVPGDRHDHDVTGPGGRGVVGAAHGARQRRSGRLRPVRVP
jgi:hypothetical protein